MRKQPSVPHRAAVLLAILLPLGLAGCRQQPGTTIVQTPPAQRLTPAPMVAPPTATAPATSGLTNTPGQPPILPDATMTPGDVLDVTKADICVKGYTQKVRNVPAAVERQVYAEYGITHRAPKEYEVDHLISLELGGSNSIKNLWPQSYVTSPWNAHVKDQIENRLHAMVCDGSIDLKEAQRLIATDWISAYKKILNTEVPLAKLPRRKRREQ